MAKTVEVELYRYSSARCYLWSEQQKWLTPSFYWQAFKEANPIICKGLRSGQNRKLKRTQLKRGFKLEIA